MMQQNDSSGVERTNDDATLCKRSAIQYGYWEDPYLSAFISRLPTGPGNFNEGRKAPEIHLGYFTRVRAVWNLLIRLSEVCHAKDKKLQVINLGAGFDTLYWRLRDYLDEKYGLVTSQTESERRSPILGNFVDVDLPEVAGKKCMFIRRSKLLLGRIAGGNEADVRVSRTDLHSSDYHIIAADLTDTASLEAKLTTDCGVDYDVPTVFIAECVLVYLEPSRVSHFLQWASKRFRSLTALINHEQLNMEDRFGQVMLDNLNQRGCALSGASACKNKTTQVGRITGAGWSGAHSWTMNEIYAMLPKDEVQRVERLERLDERELMQQLFEHYCLTIGWRNGADINLDDVVWW